LEEVLSADIESLYANIPGKCPSQSMAGLRTMYHKDEGSSLHKNQF